MRKHRHIVVNTMTTSNNPAMNIEVINIMARPVFENTQDYDMAIYTDNTNQAIHIGCGSNPIALATVKVTNNSMDIAGDFSFTGSLLKNGQAFQSGTQGLSNTGNSVYVLSGSNLGIGTSTPLHPLDVNGAIATNGVIRIASDGGLSNVRISASSITDGILSIEKGGTNTSTNTGIQGTSLVLSESPTISNATIADTTNIGGNIIATSNVAFDLGTSTKRFRDLYISSNTIDMSGTRLTSDAFNNIKITDSNNNLKRIIVDEIQVGDAALGTAMRLKKDSVSGGFKFFDVSTSGIETSSLNITTGTSDVSLCNLPMLVIGATPPNGYGANSLSVPTVSTKFIPLSANISYGSVEFGSHNAISLSANTSFTVKVTHNLGSSDYLVYSVPTEATKIKADTLNYSDNTFDLTIKNISASVIANPTVNYQIVQAATSNATTLLASPVSLTYSSSNIQTYSGATSTSKTVLIPAGMVTDPQMYPITYVLVSDNTGRSTLNGVNITYTHLKASTVGQVVVRAQNPYIIDTTKTLTFNITENYLVQPLNTISTLQYNYNSTKQLASYNLVSTDQSLPLFYTIGANDLGAILSGYTLSWTSLGFASITSHPPRTVVLNVRFDASIMAEAALAVRTVTLSVVESLSF